MPLGIAKIGLINGLAEPQYEGTNISADLLWHLKKIPVSAFNTTYDVTTANGYESNGINVGGTTYSANIRVYDGNQSWGGGTITGSGNKLVCARVNGNLTINSGYTATTSGTCNGLYLFVDGDLTVNGSISMYNKGRHISGGVSTALQINSSENEVAGSSTIKITGSQGSHTNGSSTASALTTGGGGQGGSGSYGRGNGATGHIFSGGSGGGGSGGIGYYNHYQGGGGAGGTATSYAGKGGNGGASGYTHWGYFTADAGGTGGTGNGGGNAGANNSRNASDSRAGYTGDTGTPASMVIYATGNITIASGGSLYTTGRNGRTGDHHRLKAGGGGGSAGAVLVALAGGTFTNNGTISSAGGSAGAGRGSGTTAGSGGKVTGGGYS